MRALAVIPTVGRHTLVLERIATRLEAVLEGDAIRELHARVDAYRRGRLTRDVPLALIREHVERYRVKDLAAQFYLQPHDLIR